MRFHLVPLCAVFVVSGCGAAGAASGEGAPEGAAGAGLPPVTRHIHVDQLGYLPDEQKVAVISDPRKGANAGDPFTPGPVMELRQVADGRVAWRGPAVVFNGGKTDGISGDRGWWFDFSAVRDAGEYYVFDPRLGVRSHVVRIAPGAYREVLRAALQDVLLSARGDTPQRAMGRGPVAGWPGVSAGPRGPRRLGPTGRRDRARSQRRVDGRRGHQQVPAFPGRDDPPAPLCVAANPAAFTDDLNVPESGNGLPDLLDEVKWELDWLAKMQDADGGVFVKMGTVEFSASRPLSADRHPRYYGPKCSGATIVSAGVFAHAARIFGQFEPWRAYSADLGARAARAWAWYAAHPRSYDCDSGEIKAGSANMDAAEQDRAEAIAGMHLWALTGGQGYHDVFKKRVGATRQLAEEVWPPYEMGAAEALLEYRTLPGADPAVCGKISTALAHALVSPQFMPQDGEGELYRAWMPESCYHWGSNRVRACHGIMAAAAVDYHLAGERSALLRQRALNMLHALHGVNPLDIVLSHELRDGSAGSRE